MFTASSFMLAVALPASTSVSPEYLRRQLELIHLTQEVARQQAEHARAYEEFATKLNSVTEPLDFLPLVAADAQLAAARVPLARALGDVTTAKRDLQTIIAYREMRADAVMALRTCDDVEERMEGLQAFVAEARAELAELEGDKQALRKHLNRVIAFRKRYLLRIDHLLSLRVIPDEEAAAAKESIHQQLRHWTRMLQQVR